MWISGVLASLIPGSCSPDLPVQLEKAFPPGLSLLYFCQRSQKCHCGVIQSHQGLSKTICMHGSYDVCWYACGYCGPRGIWRPLEEKGGCCITAENLCYEVRTQAAGPGSAAAQAF